MAEVLASIREFCGKVARRWYAIGVGVVGGILGLVDVVAAAAAKPKTATFSIPLWFWLPLLAGGFLGAIIWAFHDVRMERDGMRAEMTHRFEGMRYALQYGGISGSLDNAPWGAVAVRAGLDLVNHSGEYMRFEVEHFTVALGEGRWEQGPAPDRGTTLAPHGSSTLMGAAVRTQGALPLDGSLTLTVRYGHPSTAPQYYVRWEFSLYASIVTVAGSQGAHMRATLLREAEYGELPAARPILGPG